MRRLKNRKKANDCLATCTVSPSGKTAASNCNCNPFAELDNSVLYILSIFEYVKKTSEKITIDIRVIKIHIIDLPKYS